MFFTFVRDPIQHFISGFIECSSRQDPVGFKFRPTAKSLSSWLGHTRSRNGHGCCQHSMPQARFFLNGSSTSQLLDKVGFIGDMAGMQDFFVAQGLQWIPNQTALRHYPSKDAYWSLTSPNSLKPNLLFRICKYVKIDYCLFDFEPPAICKAIVQQVCNQAFALDA